jgi:hypothetical protein
MITFLTPKHQWNYFLAIEKNLENITRYVEFCDDNLAIYSIEFSHLLLSSSSEVDVIMKQLCQLLDPSSNCNNINQYRAVISAHCPEFINEEIVIERYGMSFKPWINWSNDENPYWWRSYNNVKHQRNNFFNEANLQNTVNSIGGLLIAVLYLYKLQFSIEAGHELSFRDTTFQLQPKSKFIEINNEEYYYHTAVI